MRALRLIDALIFALVLLCISACSGLGGEPQIIATAAAPQAATPAGFSADIQRGGAIFAERCSDCHGGDGSGQGDLVLAGSIPPPMDMRDRSLVAAQSPQSWYDIITDGRIENLMPPWRDALSTQERWDVALYAYTLGYDAELLQRGQQLWRDECGGCALEAALPARTASDADYGAQISREFFQAALSPGDRAAIAAYARWQTLSGGHSSAGGIPRGSFSGLVQHGSAGGILPADTRVRLQYGSPAQGFRTAETTIAADGGFRFDDIPLSSALHYTAAALYQERLFMQRPPSGAGAAERYHQVITVYDETHDPLVVHAARIELFIEPVITAEHGSSLYVRQRIGYHNRSDRIYTSGRGFEDGREATLLIQFPAAAILLSDDGSGRYVRIENMESVPNSLIDTLPVPPGDLHEVAVEYLLPYRADGVDFVQKFNNRIDAEVRIVLPGTLAVEGGWLARGDSAEGAARVYSGRLQMEAQPQLQFKITSAPAPGDAAISGAALLLLFSAGCAAFIAGAVLLYRRRPPPAQQIDELVGQIAELDERHSQGQINHDLYHQQRGALKERLAGLMRAAGDDADDGGRDA